MPKIEVSEETLKKIKEQLGENLEIKKIDSFEDLIGETYCFQCARYIYYGEVNFVNSTYIRLKNASVVFDTGDYSNSKADDKQELPNGVNVLIQSIESFFKLKW